MFPKVKQIFFIEMSILRWKWKIILKNKQLLALETVAATLRNKMN